MSVIIKNEVILDALVKETGLDAETLHMVFEAYNKIEDQVYKGFMNNYKRIVEEDKPNGSDE